MKKIDIKNQKLLLIILGLLILIFSFYVYNVFFSSKNVVDVAVNIRDSVLDFSERDDHKLDDYDSMMYAPNAIRYNTCTGETEVVNNDWAWSRDWIFLFIFDSLNSEISKNPSYVENTMRLKDSLYDQFTADDGTLELYTLWGLESYCTPYFVLNDLNLSGDFKYEETLKLAEELCYDFYSLEVAESYCEKDGYCIDDEQFYSSLENLFEYGTDAKKAKDDFSYFDDFNENKYYPVNTIADDYIFAYTNDSELFVENTNFALLNGIDYMRYSTDFFEDLVGVDTCVDSYDYYFGLLRAMQVKKNFLSDPELIERHNRVEEEFLSTCEHEYPNLEDIAFGGGFLGDRLENYYLFKDDLSKNVMNEIVEKSLENDLIYRSIEGKRHPLLNPIPLAYYQEGCYDVEVDLSKSLKTSLYMLIFSIDES